MKRRVSLLVGLGLLASACGGLGVGTPGCPTAVSQAGTAIVLSLQAVPTAKYAPCVNELKFGWKGPEFEAKRGVAETRIIAKGSNFLTARLTETCDVGTATQVESGHEDIERFEDVVTVPSHLGVAIVPAGRDQLTYARLVMRQHEDAVVEERLVRFRINQAFDETIRSRVEQAFAENDFVWIVGELDAEENTLELRQTPEGEGARGLNVAEAMDRMEDTASKITYQGSWYLRFEGGCITYEFDATGALAANLAEDVEAAFGLFPLEALRAFGDDQGYEVLPP